MKVITKQQFKTLMDDYPNGGIIFADYEPNVFASELMVTDGCFGASCIVPTNGEVFSFDWNIDEYKDSDQFAVFDNADILQMIQTLTHDLKIQLHPWWEE